MHRVYDCFNLIHNVGEYNFTHYVCSTKLCRRFSRNNNNIMMVLLYISYSYR